MLRPDLAVVIAFDTLSSERADAMPVVDRTQLADVLVPMYGLAHMLSIDYAHAVTVIGAADTRHSTAPRVLPTHVIRQHMRRFLKVVTLWAVCLG